MVTVATARRVPRVQVAAPRTESAFALQEKPTHFSTHPSLSRVKGHAYKPRPPQMQFFRLSQTDLLTHTVVKNNLRPFNMLFHEFINGIYNSPRKERPCVVYMNTTIHLCPFPVAFSKDHLSCRDHSEVWSSNDGLHSSFHDIQREEDATQQCTKTGPTDECIKSVP